MNICEQINTVRKTERTRLKDKLSCMGTVARQCRDTRVLRFYFSIPGPIAFVELISHIRLDG